MKPKAWRNRSRNIPNNIFSSVSANNSNAYDPVKTRLSESQAMPVLSWANRRLTTPTIHFSHITCEGIMSGISILLLILLVWFHKVISLCSFYFFRSRLNKAYITNHLQSLRGALSVFQFIFSLKLSSEFVFLILQGTISHIFWGKRGHAFCSKVHCMVSSPLQS